MGFAKWIGGVLGFALGGIPGGVIGFTFGGLMDSMKGAKIDPKTYRQKHKNQRYNTTADDFEYSLMILSAAVMKADGVHRKSELNYINQFYINNYGPEKAKNYMAVLQELLKSDFDLKVVSEQIRYFMQHALRLQILHYLFGIAKSDGKIDAVELNEIHKISRYLGIHQRDFESVKAMFYAYSGSYSKSRQSKSRSSSGYRYVSSKTDPYVILEITRKATDSEVKKAYRRLARKYHPDVVSHLGEKYAEQAKEKFIVIDEAYDSIKKSRGIK